MKSVYQIAIAAFITSCVTTPEDESLLRRNELIQSCNKRPSDAPEIVILSSEKMGGKNSGPMLTFYSGTVPPYFLIYRDGTVIYAKNIAKKESPFYLYRCTKLTDKEKIDFDQSIALKAEIPEPFGQFSLRATQPKSGLTEVFYFHEDKTCGQFEIRGRLKDAETLSRNIRSSVIQKIPSSVYDLMQFIDTIPNKPSIPWQPARALVRLKTFNSYKGKTQTWDPTFKLRPLRNKQQHRYQNNYYYQVAVPAERFRDFLRLFATPINYSGNTYQASYRMIFPGQKYWAGIYPTGAADNSLCNRYQDHVNYWLMYGTSAQ